MQMGTRWVADEVGDTPTLLRVDGDRATAIEVGNGVVRVRVFERTPVGWVVVGDATVETLCRVEALTEAGDLGDVLELADFLALPREAA